MILGFKINQKLPLATTSVVGELETDSSFIPSINFQGKLTESQRFCHY